MTEIENSPRLRFLDDNGEAYPDWEMKTLGEVAEDIRDRTKEFLPYLSTEDISQNYRGIQKTLNNNSKLGIKADVESILISNIRPYLKKTAFVINPCKVDTDILVLKSLNINSRFLYFSIANDKFIDYVMSNATGTKMPRGNKKYIMKYSLPVPSLPEQEKIANFLSALDENIEANEKLLELLKVEKTGYLQKIFNRELRFMNDNGEAYPDWEMKTLGDIMEKRSSSLSLSTLKTSGKYPIYAANGITKYFSDKYIDREYITIIKDGAGVGRLSKAPQNSYFIGTLQGLVSKDNTTNDFLYHILSSIDLSQSVGSTIPHIYFKDYAKKSILLPSLPEQEKIAGFLSSLDDRIDAQTELIKTLKEEKKAYLQRIFG